MRDYYSLPANYTDAGKLLGLFGARNAVEALLLAAPVFLVLFQACAPLGMTARIVAAMSPAVFLGGFALIGISDDSLSQFLICWWRWRKRRALLTYRGRDTAGPRRKVRTRRKSTDQEMASRTTSRR